MFDVKYVWHLLTEDATQRYSSVSGAEAAANNPKAQAIAKDADDSYYYISPYQVKVKPGGP